jgi:hypothetical protein
MSKNGDELQGLFLLLVGGPAAVLWGIRRLHIKRAIENTATSKVRGAAMGHIELAGIARQRKKLLSPVSAVECCWWRCKVQEWRRSGKHSRWHTIHTVGSVDLFFLDDTTGQVLVNPIGAEINVHETTQDLNSRTRTKLSPILASWGLRDSSWFGLDRPLRLVEEALPDGYPVYVLGYLSLTHSHLQDRQVRMRERLRALKADAGQMKEADFNRDGIVDPEEWDAFRLEQEKMFLQEELSKEAAHAAREQMMVIAPADGPYIISTGCEADVTGRMAWAAPLALLLGLICSGIGVYWAVRVHWHPLFIVGLVTAGVVLGFLNKSKGALSWRL